VPQNYLLVVDCNLPNEDTEIDVRKYDDEMGTTSGGYGGNDEVKIEITQRICHDGEVNRARHCPQQPNLVATKTVTSEVYLFDLDKVSLAPTTPSPRSTSPPVMCAASSPADGEHLQTGDPTQGPHPGGLWPQLEPPQEGPPSERL